MYRKYADFITGSSAVGLLIMRIIIGAGLMFHGFAKIQHPFSWMGPHSWAPGILQALSAFTEFCGGFALLVGLLTPVVAIMVLCNFLVALVAVHVPHGDPFVAKGGASYESALDYLGAACLFLLAGPGVLSLDALIFRRRGSGVPRHKQAKVGWRI